MQDEFVVVKELEFDIKGKELAVKLCLYGK
jgi:hypothetical protein